MVLWARQRTSLNDNNGDLGTHVAMVFDGQRARYFKVMYSLSHPS